jgi:hypothetical protein
VALRKFRRPQLTRQRSAAVAYDRGMASYIIWHQAGRRRAGRSEGKLLGDVQAASEEEARRLVRGISALRTPKRGKPAVF